MATFANFHVLAAPPEAVQAATLRALGAHPAFTSRNGPWTSLFPRLAAADAAGVEGLTLALSRAFSAPVIGFLSDGDSFRYWLCDRGARTDAYRSSEPGAGGDPAALAALAPGAETERIVALLRHGKTRLEADMAGFLDEWRAHRQELRARLAGDHANPDLASLLREYDHHTAQAAGEPRPAPPSELAADLGAILGIPPDLARIGFAGIADGYAPLGATNRLE